jgi:hypothetical protein
MNNENAEKEKVILKTSIITPDALYEMVYDRSAYKTSFLKMTRNGTIEDSFSEIELEGRTYKPLPPSYNLVEKGVILFPSLATPYENEEEILKEIQTFIHKYLDVSEVFEQIATYYVFFTWMYRPI